MNRKKIFLKTNICITKGAIYLTPIKNVRGACHKDVNSETI